MAYRTFLMSLLISRRPVTDTRQYRWAFGLADVFGIGIAILDRGDELIHIAPNKDEYPITVEQVRSAKANRDRYIADGIRYEPLPTLSD
jgi:hypothetical protein